MYFFLNRLLFCNKTLKRQRFILEFHFYNQTGVRISYSNKPQVSVHQEWGHSLAATASCFCFVSVSNTATTLVLHAVAVVLRYAPLKIYVPFMSWVFREGRQLPWLIAGHVLDEIKIHQKNSVERANPIPASAFARFSVAVM